MASTGTERVSPALVANHQRFLTFLERRVGSRERAEDILQAAFVRTLEHGGVPAQSTAPLSPCARWGPR